MALPNGSSEQTLPGHSMDFPEGQHSRFVAW